PSPLRQTTQPHTLGERAPQKPLCVWRAPHGEAIMPLLSSLGCSLHVSTHTHTHTHTAYLAPLSLPEDGRLRVPFGLAGEVCRVTLSHYLVPWPHHELGCLCKVNG